MLTVNEIIINAANEGIPIAAISRVVNSPFEHTHETLVAAKERGAVADLPRSDWPPGAKVADRLPSFPLPNETDLAFMCGKTFKLTTLEAGFLVALLKNRQVEKARLHGIVEHQRATRPNQPGNMEATDPKMVDVMICKLRKKLKKVDDGLKIETIWGSGYYVEAAVKPRIIAHLNGEQNVEVPPADAPAPVAG